MLLGDSSATKQGEHVLQILLNRKSHVSVKRYQQRKAMRQKIKGKKTKTNKLGGQSLTRTGAGFAVDRDEHLTIISFYYSYILFFYTDLLGTIEGPFT